MTLLCQQYESFDGDADYPAAHEAVRPALSIGRLAVVHVGYRAVLGAVLTLRAVWSRFRRPARPASPSRPIQP
jgi:hypothetical protein